MMNGLGSYLTSYEILSIICLVWGASHVDALLFTLVEHVDVELARGDVVWVGGDAVHEGLVVPSASNDSLIAAIPG